ncbi:ATP-binding protein [Plantactinospora mayteni]|uniref:histidine kinase n=1 Tax=Plantactinospora mayteni TaxID=566021 RepID=A0ABQ4F4N5_9ACTN|nr:HAMP domain-containing sensor histidine kinase [Plantactinospora mayteni]GIH01840.1 two-component sensor histidine kinase [Plantactinospora mayteni]
MGVRLRLAIAAALVIAVALGVSAAIFVFVARMILIGNIDTAARQRADEIALAVAVGDHPQVTRMLGPDTGVQIVAQVLDPSGEVEAASPALVGQPPLSALRPFAGGSLREQREVEAADEEPVRIVAVGVATAEGTRTVLVGESLRAVDESVEVIGAILAVGMPILLVVVGVATFWFVGRSLRPVEAIRRRVAGITARHLDARVPVPHTRDEVAALADTMNAMLDRLETATRSQRRFVADASHELRSPLATIHAGLERLGLTDLPDPADHYVTLMRAETQRLGRLISDLLLLARIDEHGPAPAHADVDLDDLAYTERNRLAVQHPHLKVGIRITPARVAGDADDLTRALRNLTDNAARYARTEVTLRVGIDGRDGYLDVGDDGPGVPASDRDRIFERFVRLDPSRSRTDGGSGLGLAITREIITAHGGTVTALPPETDADGLTVRIRLPLAVDRDRRNPSPCP